MDWKIMLAYVTGSVDEELLRRNECLVAENRIWRSLGYSTCVTARVQRDTTSGPCWPLLVRDESRTLC